MSERINFYKEHELDGTHTLQMYERLVIDEFGQIVYEENTEFVLQEAEAEES